MKKLIITVDEDRYLEITAAAAHLQISISDLAGHALREWLATREDQKLGWLMDRALADYRIRGGVEARRFFEEIDG